MDNLTKELLGHRLDRHLSELRGLAALDGGHMHHAARNCIGRIERTSFEDVLELLSMVGFLRHYCRIYFFIGAGRLAPVRMLAFLDADMRPSLLPG
jgi:hypothetical protein